jgi:hypothetical protein
MRYNIDFDKTINQLVPHYLGGRGFILLLQSLVKPLQVLNDAFSDWADETRIEASMTSQVFKLEWFLNRRFNKYFKSKEDKIYVSNREVLGVPLFSQNASAVYTSNPVLYQQSEEGDTLVLYMSNEKTKTSMTSFVVYVPVHDSEKITLHEYADMIKYQIDKYKLASKTYSIIYYTNTSE